MLDEDTLRHNQNCIKNQLAKFLDFDSDIHNKAILVNNYDWMKDFTFLDFARRVGKFITVNYMMAKDSVKKRLNGEARDGMSFTEFTYQLLQGYDFLHLYQTQNCKLQMGGSDQWGNITTGIELVRRTDGGEVFGLTCPLITKADGVKFGKTESGNVWLDPKKTSPYKFYQFWLNCSDDDAKRYIRIFTLFEKEEIEKMELEHDNAPHLRILQKALAKDITCRVHSEDDFNAAVAASEILFGKSSAEELTKLSKEMFFEVFEGVPQFVVDKNIFIDNINIVEFLVTHTHVFPSKGEARRMLKDNGVAINKMKVGEQSTIAMDNFINGQYLLVQKGKKNYYVIVIK